MPIKSDLFVHFQLSFQVLLMHSKKGSANIAVSGKKKKKQKHIYDVLK